ncbi:MAG: outer membrane beta-barrel protein [Dysgonamonadaceae bacterium]|jgi:hypothetical protein|nr:outer membrane beta-barrel protein [Dysgonamonadaceae bacterium]
MKLKITILAIVTFLSGSLFSQTRGVLNEFVIEKGNSPQVFYKSQGCTPNDGVIVFNTTIPNLQFSMPDAPRRLRTVSAFDKANSRYVLCLQPTDTEIGGYTKYSIDISTAGYKSTIIDVREVRAGETQYFKINPKIVDNTVEISVYDKNRNPLTSAKVGIKGSNYEARTDNKGIAKVELPSSRATTLIVSHRLYSDEKEITVTPGNKQGVFLYKLKPITQTNTSGYSETGRKFCFGIFGGLSVANQNSDAWYYEDSQSARLNFTAGMLFEFKFGKYVSFQPELLYVQKGCNGQAYTSDMYLYMESGNYIPNVLVEATMKINYLEMPFNLLFNIPIGKNRAIFLGGGPSFAYALSGKLTYNPSKEGITFYLANEEKEFDVFSEDDQILNRFDTGLNLLAGFHINRFFLRAGYDIGLIATNTDESYAYFENNCFSLTAGVKF